MKFLYLIILSLSILTIADAQTITLQPSDYPFCNAATFGEFWVGATNVSTYQWQRTNVQTPVESDWASMTEGETFYGGAAAGVTTNHLTLTGINNTSYSTAWSPPAGVRFRCVITATDNSVVKSNPATLVRNNVAGSAPSITTQPSDKIVCIASTGPSFPAPSTGGTSYQWEYRSEPVPGYGTSPAQSWRIFSPPNSFDGNICNGGTAGPRVFNATTPTLIIGPLNYTIFIDYDNYVRLKVTNGCGSIYTNQALLRVWDNYVPLTPGLETQNKKVCAGGSASFSIALPTNKKLDPPTSYDWEMEKAFSFSISDGTQNSTEVGITGNGTTYSGQGTTALAMSNITKDLNGSRVILVIYQAVCTGGNTQATLLVDYPAVFNNLTGQMTVCTGQTSSTFTVDASGNNLTYRYLVSTDGGQTYNPDSGLGTAATVTLPESYIGQKIKVEITNLCGTVTSTAQDIVRGDCFTPSIIDQPNNYPFCNDATFGEFWIGATNASTYRWQRSVVQTNIESDWTDIAENEAFYGGTATGATTNHLRLTGVSAYPTSWSYPDPKGISFRCVVTSATGSVAKSNAALLVKTDQTGSAPSISTHPPAKTIRCDNETNSVTLATAATSATSYQWQVKAESGNPTDWTDISEGGAPGSSGTTLATHTGTATNTIAINNVPELYWKTLHYYRNKVTNSCGSVYTYFGSYQTLTRPSITITTPAADVCAPASATFTATLTGGNLPSNFSYEWKRKNPSGTLYSVADGTQNNADSPPGASVGNGTVYSNVATSALSISNAPATLNGYSFVVTVQSLSCISSSNSLGLVGNAQRDILISTLPDGTASVKADLSGNQKIYICEGTSTGYPLTVTATGNNLHYQYWIKVNQPPDAFPTDFAQDTGLADAASVTLGTSYMGSNIKVKVVNACGTKELGPYPIESTPTTIPPIPSSGNPAASTICSGESTTFSVTGASGNAYPQWQISSDNTNWTDLTDGVNAGSTTSYAGTNSTNLTVNNAAVANNNFYYRLKVYTHCAVIYSGSAQLTVTAACASSPITYQPNDYTICGTTDYADFRVDAVQATGFQWYQSTLENPTTSDWVIMSNGAFYSGTATGVNSNHLELSNFSGYPTSWTGTRPGLRLRCQITFANGTLNSNMAVLVRGTGTGASARFTTNPADQMPCTNATNTQFSAATDVTATYLWQVRHENGTYYGTWQDFTGNQPPGVTDQTIVFNNYNTGTMTVPNVNNTYCTDNDNYFRLKATTGCGTFYSAPAKLSVATTLPTIGTQPPATIDKCTGDTNVQIQVAATGKNVLYQWQVRHGEAPAVWENVPITANNIGTTTNTLTYASVNSSYFTEALNYLQVLVSNACGSRTSGTTQLTVRAPNLTLVSSPVSTGICVGATLRLRIEVSGGGPYTYTWKKKGSPDAVVRSAVTKPGNTDIYELINIQAADAGDYYVEINNSCSVTPSSTTQTPATVTVYAPVAVTGGGETKSICNGEALELTVQATGGELKYRWQKDGRDVVGGTGSTYRKSEVSDEDEGTYTVIVSGVCGQPQTNQMAVVSVRTITIISPTNNSIVTKCAGQEFITAVQASGQSLSYHWMKGGVPIAAATSTTYSIPSVASTDAGVYTCEVGSGLCRSTYITRGFELKVGAGITTQPTAGQTICPGSNLNLSVEANGGSGLLSYQWTKDGSNIAGATTATYSKPNTTIADNGRYAVVVTSSCGTTTSKEAVVIVSKELEIFQQPVSTTLCVGKDGSLEAFGTEGALNQWQFKQGSSWVSVANGAASDGTVYASATTSTLQFSNTTTSAAGTYRCRIYNTCNQEKFTNEAVVSVSAGGVPITQQPLPQTVCAGDNINLSVAATGNNLKYQWTKDGLNVGINASTFTKTAATGDQGIYQVNVMDGCASTLSNPVQVSMGVGIDIPPQSQTICPSSRLSLSVTVSGSGPFTPQWFKDGSSIAGANTGTYTVDNITAGDAGNYTVQVTGSCGSVTSPVAVVSLSVGFNSALPSDMTVCSGGIANFKVEATGSALTYQWQYLNGSTWTNATNATIRSSIWAGTTTAQVSIGDVTDASFYDGLRIRCLVKSNCNSSSMPSAAATLNIGNGVTSIATQPRASQVLCVGQEYFVTVVPSGLGTLTYNWKKNGTPIGVTTADFRIPKVTTDDAGTYTVDISSSCSIDVVTSADAVLTVGKMAIEIAPEKSLVKCNGSDLSLSILTSGITPFQYQWTLNGSLLSSISSEHTKTGITKDDAGIYEVTVSSASCPDGVSAQSTVTVTNGVVSQPPANQLGCYGGEVTLPVETVGSNLTFQWFKDNVELPDQVQASLHLTNLQEADKGSYTLKVGSPGCTPLPTSSTVLTISKLSFTTNLPNGTIEQCGGPNKSLVLTVVPKGTEPFSYQWKKNTHDIEGAVNSTYRIESPRAQDAGTYSVTVNDFCHSPLNSESTEVKINSSIVEQPSEETTVCNNSFRLHVTSKDIPATYQWKKNGIDIPGATTDTYQNDNANTDDSGIYTVEVIPQTSSCGTILSNDANVAVGAGIRTQPQTQSLCRGEAMKMKVESFVPKSSTFVWKKDGQVISGETKNTYEILAPPGVETAHQGIYTVDVTNTCGSITSDKANLYVGPGIAKQPENTEACLGLEANTEVTAAGSNPTYKWYKNGVLLDNQTSSRLHFDQVTTNDLATYVVKVNVCATELTSNEVTLRATSGGYFATGKLSTNPPDAVIKYGEKIDFKYDGPNKNVIFTWNFGDGSFVSTDEDPIHYYYKVGNLNVRLHVSVSGTTCEKDIELATIVKVVAPGVEIYTGDQKNHNLTAHPVPFTTELTIENTTVMNRVRLVTIQGIDVISQSCNDKKVSLYTENLASGIYIVIVETNEGVTHVKVVK